MNSLEQKEQKTQGEEITEQERAMLEAIKKEWKTQDERLAQFKIGYRYLEGIKIPRDYVRALFWLIKSAEAGYLDAQLQLGEVYYKGYGKPYGKDIHGQVIEQDKEKAKYWLNKAGEQGKANLQLYELMDRK